LTEIEVRRHLLRAAILGVLVTALLVGYQLVADSLRLQPLHPVLFVFVALICPPCLLSIPFIDVDPGTGAFYFIWSLIACFNAVVYALVSLTVMRSPEKSKQSQL